MVIVSSIRDPHITSYLHQINFVANVKNTFCLDFDNRAITVVHGGIHNGKFAVILDIFLLYVSVIHEKDNHMLRM